MVPQGVSETVETVYERLANEEDARVCTDLSEEACRYVPTNFLRIVGSTVLTQTGDALINPKTEVQVLRKHTSWRQIRGLGRTIRE
jgi:hypothetical protein